MAERPYVAEVCRGLLRRGSQGRKRGKLTLIARMDRGHGDRGPFSLTEEDDDDDEDEDLLTDEDAMSQDKEEQQLWPDMCSPCRPFFKYHGPGPDPWSPGAMAATWLLLRKTKGRARGGLGV